MLLESAAVDFVGDAFGHLKAMPPPRARKRMLRAVIAA